MFLMKLLAFATVIVVALAQGNVLKPINLNSACPFGTFASFSGDKCWLLVTSPQNFIEAAQYCQSYGGNLTSIHDAFDNIFLADKAEKQFTQADIYYIGGSNLRDKKNWSWVDQTPVDFMDWANYEPIDQDVNNCLTVSVGHGLWHAHDCTSPAPFVCEVPQGDMNNNSTNPPPTMTTPNSNWNLTTPARETTMILNVSIATMITPPPNVNNSAATGSWNVSTLTPFPGTTNNGTMMPPMTTINITNWNQSTTPGSGNVTMMTMQTAIANDTTRPSSKQPMPPSPSSSSGGGQQNNPQSHHPSSDIPTSGSSGGHGPSFKTLLGSLAVGKAMEFFPKFDQLKHQNGRHHFKSYRQI